MATTKPPHAPMLPPLRCPAPLMPSAVGLRSLSLAPPPPTRSFPGLLDLPDGVLAHIFTSLTAQPCAVTLTGRGLNRGHLALPLAHCSRRLMRVFRGSLRHLHIDGSENPVLDSDAALARLLALAKPSLTSLSLKWLPSVSLNPLRGHLGCQGASPLTTLALHGVPVRVGRDAFAAVLAAAGARLEVLSLVANTALATRPGANAALSALAAARPAALMRLELGGVGASANALIDVVQSAPLLQSLELHELPQIDDDALRALASAAPQLLSLTVSGLPLTGAGVLSAAMLLPGLEELCAEGARLSDASPLALTTACPRLTSLCVARARAPELPGSSVLAAAAALGPGLRRLSVHAAPGFTDARLAALVSACPSLESVGLRACGSVSGAGVAGLASSLGGRLLSVDLSASRLVDDTALDALARYCPALEFAWLAGLPLLTGPGIARFLSRAGSRLRDLSLAQTALGPARAAALVAASCAGPLLECVVLDGAGPRESTWEAERRTGTAAPGLARSLDGLRATCVNAIVVLEQQGLPEAAVAAVSDAMEVEWR